MPDFVFLNGLFAELGRRYGITGLQIGTSGTMGLRLKDGSELDFEYDTGRKRLYVYTAIISIPKDEAQRLKLFDAMLDLNCLEKGVPCGTLSLHRQQEVAIYQAGLTVAGLTLPVLERTIRDLLAGRTDIARTLGHVLDNNASCMPTAGAVRYGTASLLAARHIVR